MKRGDIYLVNVEPAMGREQRCALPVLIVSATAFNNATRLPVILPITNGGAFASRISFAVPIAGIKTTGVVRCDQPRVIDLAARGGRMVDHLPVAILADVPARVTTIFSKATELVEEAS